MTQSPDADLDPHKLRADALRVLESLNRLRLPTDEPYLPLLFRLNGKPYTLEDHFPFSPMFRTRLPDRRILKTARQVAKTTYLAASGLLLTAKMPYFKQLFITPLFEQIRRFSVNYMEPFIDESAIKGMIVDSSCNQSVLQRTFLNKSLMIFSYAYLSSSRVRGIGNIYRTSIDEFQDMDQEHVPIIGETMSAAPPPWGIWDFTGTPKGFDNPMERTWDGSSQAEWVIRCEHGGCGHYNYCRADLDLIKIIGPVRDDIGPDNPGTVCAKCRKVIYPKRGFWHHEFKDRRWTFQGYHIPQPIMPMHYGDRKKWSILVGKMNGENDTPPHVFHNEALGESFDTGSKLLTETELRRACVLGWDNDPKNVPAFAVDPAFRINYRLTLMAIDWGGGGGDGVKLQSEAGRRRRKSFTTIAFMGMKNDGGIDVIWGTRLLTPNDHALEAEQILAFLRILKPNLIAHDFTGAGAARQTILEQRGVSEQMFFGFDYKYVPSGRIIQPVVQAHKSNPYYRIDKTRTILTTLNAIKFGRVHFFRYDYQSKENPGLLADLLALTEEKIETAAADRYVIRRLPSSPDDFAHSVNIGCCCLWHSTQSWPAFVHSMHSSPDYESDAVAYRD